MASARMTLLFVGLLLFSIQVALTNEGLTSRPIRLSVVNDLSNLTPETHFTSVVQGGVLLGALRKIQETQHDFKFTVKEDPNFGLFLESVNGVAGNDNDQTYWEILSEDSGEYTRLDVGIGCYTPAENEHIVLRFSTWSK
ncbi:transcobalamin-1-like [Dunckerocampus dactyliophorus]|uniref:transcobalamin-1-like n=1 Tax=Dunckerocampus dactyliophorus TaxID=161453 RepID=UPI0024054AC6|nr:transcobalamin-1-like [Dunckerocampus dactyliophorus]